MGYFRVTPSDNNIIHIHYQQNNTRTGVPIENEVVRFTLLHAKFLNGLVEFTKS